MTQSTTRTIELSRKVDATPDEVWEMLTTDRGLSNWFPLEARVAESGKGTVWLSWGPGCEGEAPIHIWEPGARFGWTEDYGTSPDGVPIKVGVDFHIESEDGSTVLRLVQTGLSAADEWSEMYDALVDGWTYFLFNLVHYFRHHKGKVRRMAWKRAATDLGREAAWERLVGGALVASSLAPGEATIELDQLRQTEVVSSRPGHHFACTVPSLENGIFFVELEGAHIGFWLSTYGVDEETVARLQAALEERIAKALPEPAASGA